MARMNRRSFLRLIGLAVATPVLAPVLAPLAAPVPAQIQGELGTRYGMEIYEFTGFQPGDQFIIAGSSQIYTVSHVRPS